MNVTYIFNSEDNKIDPIKQQSHPTFSVGGTLRIWEPNEIN